MDLYFIYAFYCISRHCYNTNTCRIITTSVLRLCFRFNPYIQAVYTIITPVFQVPIPTGKQYVPAHVRLFNKNNLTRHDSCIFPIRGLRRREWGKGKMEHRSCSNTIRWIRFWKPNRRGSF